MIAEDKTGNLWFGTWERRLFQNLMARPLLIILKRRIG
ncbi:MAG: hypothetical protein IPP81_22025 [Chitinophagaceae bacterium]|nr:hypothetical protein [Chitinophagaceae bacterium]